MFGLDPDSQARVFYLVLLGAAVAFWAFQHYRNRLSQAMQHAAIWVLIFLAGVLAFGFKDQILLALDDGAARQINDGTVVLNRRNDGHFHATAEVDGVDIRFLVDTGASSVVLSRRDAERLGIDTATLNYLVEVQTANGRTRAARVVLDEVRLGEFVDRDVPALVNEGDLDGSLLGMTYIDRYRSFRMEGDRLFLSR